MASAVFPVTTTSSLNAVAAVPGASAKQYVITRNFTSGIYTITVSDASNAYVEFVGSSSVVTATTTSGTVTVNLAVDCTSAIVTLLTSASASVKIDQTALTLVSTEISGTLDTITTLGATTYTQTGKLYVLCVGGGGGGASAVSDVAEGGRGASVSGKLVYTTASTTVTVGAGGTGAGANTNANGGTGGTTTFGTLVSATGGAGGRFSFRTNPVTNGVNYWGTIKTGNTSSGGGGANGANGIETYNNTIADTGLGTGGKGGTTSTPGSGVGFRDGAVGGNYGNGGGGSFGTSGAAGGAGGQGVVYVLRGF